MRQNLLYDVIVVGAGPAGSTAARELAKLGYKVLLLEKDKLPHLKPCGGMLSPRCLKILDFDLSPIIEDEVHTVISTYKGKTRRKIEFPGIVGYQISRSEFDFHLIKKAQEAGAEVKESEEVVELKQDEGGVEVCSNKGLYRAKKVVVADGVLSRFNKAEDREFGASVVAEVYPRDKGLLEKFSKTAIFDFGLIPGGYGWVFKKKDHLNVGVGTSFKREFSNLKNCAMKLLKSEGLIRPDNEVKFYAAPVAMFSHEEKPLVDGHLVFIGDAAQLADPLTAEGIYFAILSGKLAAQAIHSGALLEYEEKVKKEIIPELKLAKRIANLFYKNAFILYYIGVLDPRYIRSYLEVLSGQKTYRQFVDEYKGFLGKSVLLKWVFGFIRRQR